MATIIDSLLVTLSLDAKAFNVGRKDVDKGLKDTKDGADRTAKDLEAKGKVAAQFFGQIRNQVLALAATFTAGAGLKSFVENITSADAAVGRTARNIGVTTDVLSAWQGVAERAGGTAAGITGSMQGLSQQFQQLALTGQSSVVPYFRAAGVALADANGKMRPMAEIFLDLSDKFEKMDPQRAQALGRGMVLDEGTVNVIMQGRAAIVGLLAEQEKLNYVSAEDAAAAQERKKAFAELEQGSAQLGRMLLTTLTPAIKTVVGWLTQLGEWFKDHPATLTAFGVAMGAVAASVTAAMTMMSVKGFLGLAASLLRIGPAAAVATAALETAAAKSSAGLLRMLGALAGSTALVAAAGAVGYVIGSAIYKAIEDTKLADKIGQFVTVALAAMGNKEAQKTLEAELNAKAGLSPTRQRSALPAPGVMPQDSATPQVAQASPSGSSAPRGMRNNNPGNLNYAGQRGATKEAGPGGRFAVFPSMEAGIAALGKQLQVYASRGEDSVRRIISKYAPAGENNTEAYIASVAKKLGVGTDQRLNLKDPVVLKGMVQAITDVEIGKGKLPDRQIDAGLVAMGVTPPRSLLQPGPQLDPALQTGAAAAVASNTTNNTSSSSSHAETHIGEVNVTLPNATDATSVASGLAPALKRSFSVAAQANYGLN